MASTEQIEQAWRAGGWAVVWKVAGVPLVDDASRQGKEELRRGGRPPPESVGAWAAKRLDGSWQVVTSLGDSCAGLVLVARKCPERFEEPVRGSYVALVAPPAAPSSAVLADGGSKEAKAGALWQPLELFGGIDDKASVLEEGASGHFGRLALVELSVPLTGACTLSPLAAVLEIQDLGLRVVQLPSHKGNEVRNPCAPLQEEGQADVLPGTCLALTSLCLPSESISASARARRPSAGFNSVVKHPTPAKFAKVLAAESALAAQRRKSTDGMATFRGLPFLAPEEQLRPRAASTVLVDAALKALEGRKEEARVLDLGVGCGTLLLSILHSLGSGARGWGLDLDEGAVEACRANAKGILGEEGAERVAVVLADFGQLHTSPVRSKLAAEGYDVIVCNPPYRSEEQQRAYDVAAGQFGGHTEHAKTLVAGKTGLELYEAVASSLARDAAEAAKTPGCSPLLRPGSLLIFQVEAGGRGQRGGAAARVGSAVERAAGGFLKVKGMQADELGLERAILVEVAAGSL